MIKPRVPTAATMVRLQCQRDAEEVIIDNSPQSKARRRGQLLMRALRLRGRCQVSATNFTSAHMKYIKYPQTACATENSVRLFLFRAPGWKSGRCTAVRGMLRTHFDLPVRCQWRHPLPSGEEDNLPPSKPSCLTTTSGSLEV